MLGINAASCWNEDVLRKVKRPAVTGNQTMQGHLACAASALPLSYNNWTITVYQPLPCSGCWVCISVLSVTTYRGLWKLVVVWLLWLSGRALHCCTSQVHCMGRDQCSFWTAHRPTYLLPSRSECCTVASFPGSPGTERKYVYVGRAWYIFYIIMM